MVLDKKQYTMDFIMQHIEVIEKLASDVKYLNYNKLQDISQLKYTNRTAYSELKSVEPQQKAEDEISRHLTYWSACREELRCQVKEEFNNIYSEGAVDKTDFNLEKIKLYDALRSYAKGLRGIADNPSENFDSIKVIAK